MSKLLPYGAIWSTVNWPENCTLQYDRLQQRYRRASNMIGILPIGTLPGEDQPKAALFWSLPRTEINAWREAPIERWRDQATKLWPELAPLTDQITDHAQMTPQCIRMAVYASRFPTGWSISVTLPSAQAHS